MQMFSFSVKRGGNKHSLHFEGRGGIDKGEWEVLDIRFVLVGDGVHTTACD